MEKYLVYKHTNKINNKVYIGITKNINNPNKRWKNGMGYSYNEKFFSDIVKYGWDNFEHDILETDLSAPEAVSRESYYIKYFNSVVEGYNNSYGGNIPSEEGIETIRQSLIGITRSKETIEKQMKTKEERYGNGKGKNFNGFTRKVKCNETGDVFLSIKEAERWCGSSKVQLCCKGERLHAGVHPITKEKLSWSYADENSNVTIYCDEIIKETKKIIKKIQCIETEKVYINASEAFRDTGIATCNILRACKGERKSAGGLHWRYYEEE